jgi:flagellar assembly factor FliW
MSAMLVANSLAEVAEVEFIEPILGFAGESRFRLVSLEHTGVLWALESTHTEGLRFVVAVPEPFFPAYSPVVDAHVVAPLLDADQAPEDASGLQLLVILTVTGAITTATANLMAPLIVSLATARARQVVLTDDTLSLRAPLSPAVAG